MSAAPMTPNDAAGALFDTCAVLKALHARLAELAGQPFGEDEATEVGRIVRLAHTSVYEVACDVADFKPYAEGAQ